MGGGNTGWITKGDVVLCGPDPPSRDRPSMRAARLNWLVAIRLSQHTSYQDYLLAFQTMAAQVRND